MDSIPYETVSLEEAKASVHGPIAKVETAPPPKKNWTPSRLPTHNADDLAAATFKWLATLPKEARPNALALKFPRIANRLAEIWKRPLQCERYMDDLITDGRGDRQGFPTDVVADLAALKKYFMKTNKTVHYGVWGNRIGFD